MYDYLIVGAGLFGSVFAHEMTSKKKKCLVIDKRPHIGGNCYTEQTAEINVHKYGPHIFHTSDKKVWDYINNFTEINHFINSPLAVYDDELYNLPFNMNTFNRMWKVKTPAEAKEIIFRQIKEAAIEKPRNLEEQAISTAGTDIYHKLIEGYTEKQWGRSCKELPAFIINRIPLRFTYDNNYFKDPYQGVPKGGYTRIFDKLLEGSEVRLNTDYFLLENKSIAKKTVFSGSIDSFFGYRFGRLEYRSLRFETEVLDCEDFQGNAVVNYTSKNVPYTRIIEHKHFENGKQKKTVITREYPMKFSESSEPFYPVNDDRNNELYGKYRALSDEYRNVIFGGRLGEYRYCNMDETIAAALSAAEKCE